MREVFFSRVLIAFSCSRIAKKEIVMVPLELARVAVALEDQVTAC